MQKTEEITFSPHSVASTKPENLIDYTEVQIDGTTLGNISEMFQKPRFLLILERNIRISKESLLSVEIISATLPPMELPD